MKFYKSLFLAAVAAVAFTSCSDEGYWEQYEMTETQYSFDQTKQSFSLTAADSLPSVKVALSRSTNKGEATLPLNISFSSPILSVADSSVTFADGSYTAELVVNVDEANIVMGTSYTANIAFAVDSVNFFEHNYSVSGNKTHAISIIKDYTWVSAGTVYMASNWAGGYAYVPVENAKEYANENGYKLYRLNSPYYYLEPSYCPKPGAHIQFILDAQGNAVSLAASFQAIGEAASKGGEWYMYYSPSQPFCAFTNSGNIYTILCGWAYGGPSVGSYYLCYNDGKEMFQWVEGWPGATE